MCGAAMRAQSIQCRVEFRFATPVCVAVGARRDEWRGREVGGGARAGLSHSPCVCVLVKVRGL